MARAVLKKSTERPSSDDDLKRSPLHVIDDFLLPPAQHRMTDAAAGATRPKDDAVAPPTLQDDAIATPLLNFEVDARPLFEVHSCVELALWAPGGDTDCGYIVVSDPSETARRSDV